MSRHWSRELSSLSSPSVRPSVDARRLMHVRHMGSLVQAMALVRKKLTEALQSDAVAAVHQEMNVLREEELAKRTELESQLAECRANLKSSRADAAATADNLEKAQQRETALSQQITEQRGP